MARSLQSLHKTLINRAEEFRGKLIRRIEQLPDNQSIKVSGSPRCFTVNFSQLQRNCNLSAKFYDFRVQYQEIIERIKKSRIESLPGLFEKIQSETQYHDEVKKHLLEVWD